MPSQAKKLMICPSSHYLGTIFGEKNKNKSKTNKTNKQTKTMVPDNADKIQINVNKVCKYPWRIMWIAYFFFVLFIKVKRGGPKKQNKKQTNKKQPWCHDNADKIQINVNKVCKYPWRIMWIAYFFFVSFIKVKRGGQKTPSPFFDPPPLQRRNKPNKKNQKTNTV